MKKPNEKFDQFLNFLNDTSSVDAPTLRKDLEADGINMKRIDDGVASILKEVDRAIKRTQLDRAKEQRASFGQTLKDAAKTTFGFGSRKELVDAILSGKFGGVAQGRLQVQFRNRKPDELSDEDLKGLLDDQEILALLEKFRGSKK